MEFKVYITLDIEPEDGDFNTAESELNVAIDNMFNYLNNPDEDIRWKLIDIELK